MERFGRILGHHGGLRHQPHSSLFLSSIKSNRSQLPGGKLEVAAGWQTALMNASVVGSLFGLAINGLLCDWLGCKKTFTVGLMMMNDAIFCAFFADNVGILVASEFLRGLKPST